MFKLWIDLQQLKCSFQVLWTDFVPTEKLILFRNEIEFSFFVRLKYVAMECIPDQSSFLLSSENFTKIGTQARFLWKKDWVNWLRAQSLLLGLHWNQIGCWCHVGPIRFLFTTRPSKISQRRIFDLMRNFNWFQKSKSTWTEHNWLEIQLKSI